MDQGDRDTEERSRFERAGALPAECLRGEKARRKTGTGRSFVAGHAEDFLPDIENNSRRARMATETVTGAVTASREVNSSNLAVVTLRMPPPFGCSVAARKSEL